MFALNQIALVIAGATNSNRKAEVHENWKVLDRKSYA